MSNVAGPAVITQTLSTIPETPAPEAAPETNAGAPPAAPSEAASGAGAKPAAPDRSLELARKFESVAQRESKARRLEREAQAKAQAIADREKKLAERERELDDALGDPVGHMLKIGKDPLEVAQRYAKPETAEEKRIRQLEERLAKQDEEKAAQQTEREKRQEKLRADAAEKHRMTVMREFVGAITEKECPNLTALYEAHQVPGLVDELLQRPMDPSDPESPSMIQAFVAQHRRNPTDKEIREALEHEAELRATKVLTRNRAAAASSGAQSGEAPTQDPAKTGRGPGGISNQHAAVTATGKKRPPTIEEKRKETRRQLTAALEAEGNEDR
jgi:hypothetical protein